MGQRGTAERTEVRVAELRVAGLIVKLGDPLFAVRESASRELVSLGAASKGALLAALKNPDAEVRRRTQRILVEVLEADFQLRLDAFTTDSNNANSHDLPCWKQFRQLAGDSPQARQLFIEAVRAEPVLLESVEQDPRRGAEAVTSRCNLVMALFARSRWPVSHEPQDGRVSLGRMAALMLAACVTEAPNDEALGGRIYQLFHQSRMIDEVANGTQGQPARRLLGGWIRHNAESSLAFQCMWLGLRYDLKDGLAPAAVLVKRADQQVYVRQMAILAIAKLGGPEQVPWLAPLLSDATPCDDAISAQQSFKSIDGGYRCEIRDVALAAIIHLYGQDPKNFGFEKIAANSQTLFQQNSMGFVDPQRRADALARWKSWVQDPQRLAKKPGQQPPKEQRSTQQRPPSPPQPAAHNSQLDSKPSA